MRIRFAAPIEISRLYFSKALVSYAREHPNLSFVLQPEATLAGLRAGAVDAIVLSDVPAVAEDLVEIGEDELDGDEDAPSGHDSAPFGDAEIVDDLGTSPSDLLAMCAHEGTLPIDVLVAVCEKAGCGEAFDDLRA